MGHQLGVPCLRATCLVSCPVSCWLCWLWLGHLDFVGISSALPLPPLLDFIAWPVTCMSQNTSQDHDVVELSLDFADLSISIRGPPSSAAAFVRNLGSPAGSVSAVPQSPGGYSNSSPAPSASGSQAQAPILPLDSRSGLAASFPPVPQRWLRLSSRLGASNLSSEARINRAWIAGFWARAVVEERIGSPNRSTACSLSNRYWAVVRCEGLRTPRIFTSSRRFFAAVGQIEGSPTVCHAFPSETEAAVYLEAANCTFPTSFD